MGVEKLIGAAVRRVEDERFLTGRGHFTDDLGFERACFATVVRSPYAHARIRTIAVQAARSMPGVLLVMTGAEVVRLLRPIPTLVGIDSRTFLDRDGNPMPDPPHWPLAPDLVRHVGDPVAFVVAETLEQARDAAERVEVEYDPLPAVIELDDALAPGATRVWERYPSNRSFEIERGDRGAVDAAFAGAAHVARVELENNRQVVAFMEPRSVVAEFDDRTETYTVHVGAQSAHSVRNVLSMMLGIDPARMRVIVPDTGGGFGARNTVYPEFALAALAARRLSRPVRWTAERSESFLTDTQGRDQRLSAELALDENGRFLAIRARAAWRHGAYLPTRSLWVHISFMAPMLCGAYDIAHVHFEMRGVFTHTAPVHAFRGVGRAEAAYLLERLVDTAAREVGLDPVELRRRNFIRPETMPCTTAAGAAYGRCEFEITLDRALGAIDWPGFSRRRAASRERGRLRGIGCSVYIESTGGVPSEFAEVRISPGGTVDAYVGTQSFGMGHETAFAQVLADELGIELGRMRIIHGDTARVRTGFGSHGSRSMRLGGGALVLGVQQMIEHGRNLAAEQLEAAPADIEYQDGKFVIAGTDRSVGLFELAEVAARRGDRLQGDAVFETASPAYASGAHVCEVEIDPETGKVTIVAHGLVIDAGRVINPLITEGQLHGGIAQGIGQAVLEHVVYEAASGQLLSGSFLDYALPRADDLPAFVTGFHPVWCDDNPLGVKGAGEGPTTGCPPAVMNAILDALAERGVTTLDMPATPERVWRAIHVAASRD